MYKVSNTLKLFKTFIINTKFYTRKQNKKIRLFSFGFTSNVFIWKLVKISSKAILAVDREKLFQCFFANWSMYRNNRSNDVPCVNV